MNPAGFVPFVATRIQDASGNLLASGTLEVLPTNTVNRPVSAAAGGVGGQLYSNRPAIFPVSGGALPSTAQIADTTQTLPQNICYRITVKDAFGTPLLILTQVQTLANTPLNLDTYLSSPGGPLAIVVVGPQGPPGPMASIADSITAQVYNFAIFNGRLTVVAAGSLAGVFVANTGSGLPASVVVTGGRLTITPVPVSPLISTLVAAATVLIDTVLNAPFTLCTVTDGGVERLTAIAGGSTLRAQSSLTLADSDGSDLWRLTVAVGRITIIPF